MSPSLKTCPPLLKLSREIAFWHCLLKLLKLLPDPRFVFVLKLGFFTRFDFLFGQDTLWVRFAIDQLVTQLQLVTVAPINFVGLTPVQLLEALLLLTAETNQLIGGLGRTIIQYPSIADEFLPVQPHGFQGPRGATSLLELSDTPLPLAAVWEGEVVGEPAKPPIRGRRPRGQTRPGASDPSPTKSKSSARKSKAKRPLRGEAPAEFSIANPPVSSPLMLSKPNNSLLPRTFLMTPNFYSIPRKLRYR